jgi:glycosyltransferase involved in cell wall biosynthesis
VRCSFIGDGDEKDLLRAAVYRKGLNDKIGFIGFSEGSEYKKRLAEHHIMVLLSDYEGTPGCLMDGMSCALVPVSSQYNGVKELIAHGDNGVIVQSVGGAGEWIGRLVADRELRAKLGRNARRSIEERYSLPGAVAKWEAFLLRLLESEGRQVREIKVPWRFAGRYEEGLIGWEKPGGFVGVDVVKDLYRTIRRSGLLRRVNEPERS